MKLSTKLIQTVEITQEEEDDLWPKYFDAPREERNVLICGKRLLDWRREDGHHDMHLEGEDFYREVDVIYHTES
jgi:hypothetical protein